MGLYEQFDCASKQAFCTLGYQTVTQLKDIGLLSNSQITYTAPSADTIIVNTAWVKIKQILQNIYDVGSYSSGRLPRYIENGVTYTPNSINNINQYHTVDLNEYNMILKLLKQNGLSNNPYITATRLSLQNIINSFTIEDTRCNYCNLACDITCNTIQCCDSDCNCNCNCDCNCNGCSACDAAFDSYNGGCGCTYWDNG